MAKRSIWGKTHIPWKRIIHRKCFIWNNFNKSQMMSEITQKCDIIFLYLLAVVALLSSPFPLPFSSANFKFIYLMTHKWCHLSIKRVWKRRSTSLIFRANMLATIWNKPNKTAMFCLFSDWAGFKSLYSSSKAK